MERAGDPFVGWQLPAGDTLLERVERMVNPHIWAGRFGESATIMVLGLQYHLGGHQDTTELAELCGIGTQDRVLDTCCFMGGPALQLAETYGCTVTGFDLWDAPLWAAQRIAQLCDLRDRLHYVKADAGAIPFRDESFSVVWNQCSLEHDPAWIGAFDHVLAPGGRMALTFQHCGKTRDPDDPFGRWSIGDLCGRLQARGYAILHADDISERDIAIGWQAMINRLRSERKTFAARLGEEWVHQALSEFEGEIVRMRAGAWGNGRIVAQKPEAAD